jgi:hypothetical protein
MSHLETEDIPLTIIEDGTSTTVHTALQPNLETEDTRTNRQDRYYQTDYSRFYKFSFCFLFALSISFMLMWLSESQFGEGILRPKYINETCQPEWSDGRKCVGSRCVKGRCMKECGDVQIVYLNQSNPDNTPCPPQNVVEKVTKLVTFYDFVEFPNTYLRPKSDLSKFKTVQEVSYNACKELCSRETKCVAVNYAPGTSTCIFMQSYIIPQIASTDWITAFKIN